MPCRLIDIRPNHDLLNSDFEGYKLSLENVPTIQKNLPTTVLRTLPKSSQYSFLHVKLLGLHNHLYGETNLDGDCLYYIDSSWKVNKISINPVYEDNNELSVVFDIPQPERHEEASFNASLLFLNHVGLALLTDGYGKFYILDTNENSWKIIYSEELLKIGSQFSIKDAKCSINSENLRTVDCVFLSIKNEEDKHFSVLHLITFVEDDKKTWVQTIFKELYCKGIIYYNYLDRGDNDALIVVSDKPVEFIQDSEHPVKKKSTDPRKKIYKWSQNESQITLIIPLTKCESAEPSLMPSEEEIKVAFTDDAISIKFQENAILEGKLHARILEEECSFKVKDNVLTVLLSKWEGAMMWPEIVIGDRSGEYDVSIEDVESVHRKLGHLCADEEVSNDDHHIYNTEQTEDCDDADPISAPILQRLDTGAAHSATHRVNLNAHGVLLTVPAENSATEVPSIGLRIDVDTLIFKLGKKLDKPWDMWHDGTLNAFGYVQASKQQRKFTVCPPDLSYVAILESSRHIFLYRQDRAVSGGCELRHRTSGRRVAAVAQQQVISVGSDEVLGVFVTNTTMYVLTETEFIILTVV